MDKRIVIIGGGPCGLGAATRLQQLNHQNWTLLEKSDYLGGLSTSFVDDQGFTWDIGGHVIFSHYQYFNDLIDAGILYYANNLNDKRITDEEKADVKKLWCTHKRESWVRFTPETWTEYPFQNHFYSLNNSQLSKDCIEGILDANQQAVLNRNKPAKDFQEWIDRTFGKGLATHFMNPYNFKVWGYHPSEMNADWVGERVATIDVKQTLDSIIKLSSKDNVKNVNANWGPNAFFRYPKYGGTGAIWRGVGAKLDKKHIQTGAEVEEIDIEAKTIKLKNNSTIINYDYLISTLPIDHLITKTIKPTKELNVESFMQLGKPIYSSTHVIGLGINGKVPDSLADKSWMYFPSEKSPFYRATVLSNYSPYMVKETDKQWSLMIEVCESIHRPRIENIIEDTIKGALYEKLIRPEDVENIISKWHIRMEYGYPTPYLNRQPFLNAIEPLLRKKYSIYSRGRFGAWKYEVSNQDHSLMQGVESVDNILFGVEEQTFFYPDHVNNRKETTRTFS